MQVDPKGNPYWDRWLFPDQRLNAGTNLEGRPVRNHPEHIPWDSSLNKDVDDWIHYQVVLTEILPKKDNGYFPKEKFIWSTPKLQYRAYLCVVDPALGPNAVTPQGSRIVQDFEKCFGQTLTINWRANGWSLYGCVNHDRHCLNTNYFGPNREANREWVSRPRFTHGGVQVEV